MKKIKYTDFEEHKKFQDEFMAKFHEMETEFMRVGPTETLVNTIFMITMDWLKEHIVEADFKYAKNSMIRGDFVPFPALQKMVNRSYSLALRIE